jgi:hypothetical protein
MSMFFFDETDELEEYQTFRRRDQPLELEYEKLRLTLRDVETALQGNPKDTALAVKVAEIKDRLAALEKQAPWLNYDYPVEYLLWGPPHG